MTVFIFGEYIESVAIVCADIAKQAITLTKKENNLLLITLYRDLFFRILQT
jgi:hypothetical protein